MAETPAAATYYWTEGFNTDSDMTGALVGFKVSEVNTYDLSETGILQKVGSFYEVVIQGVTLRADKGGVVRSSTPSGSSYVDRTLMVVTAEMDASSSIGGAITRSAEKETGYKQTAILTTIEPRDQFAVQALNAMLIHADHPETFDDAKMLFYSRSAYRWAQAMMIAAADSRHGESEKQGQTTIDVNANDLQSNTEKLLYNMVDYMKNGLTVVGTTADGKVPVQMNVTGMPDVNVVSMPDVTIADMPDVNVKNPLDENDEPIPLIVSNPTTESSGEGE